MISKQFNKENPQYNLVATPVDHEAFKTSIRVMLAGGNPPNLFSYWAGARVQFIVDAGQLAPIDDVYETNKLNDLFPPAVKQGCTYNGHKYFLPLTQHFVAFFYNKAIFKKAGGDIECGTGLFTIRAAEKGAKVKGIDINPAMLEIAEKCLKSSRI